MTLGREVDNNIEIKDIDIARYHARISFEGGHYTIQDLEGSSGTFVDGQKISKAVLTPGSSIRVGNSELKLEPGLIPTGERRSDPLYRGDATPTRRARREARFSSRRPR